MIHSACIERNTFVAQQDERSKLLTERLKKYTQRVYKRVLDKPVTELRVAGICQRENSFYVDTVRAFRDRRLQYKGLNKVRLRNEKLIQIYAVYKRKRLIQLSLILNNTSTDIRA